FPAVGQLPYLLTLPPYGFYWFELSASAAPPAWHAAMPEPGLEFVTLVLRGHTGYQLTEGSMRTLYSDVLPGYLARQRWFPRGGPAGTPRIAYALPLPGVPEELFLAELEIG